MQQLRYVVALARHGSFSEAAREVHVSQPALSQQIKKLEEELGVPLFERLSTGVKLTEGGERFLPRAMDVLDKVRGARACLESDAGTPRGTLKIGIIPTIAPYFLPDFMNSLHREAPDVRVYVEEQQTETLLDRLKIGTVDHLFLSPPLPDEGVVREPVGEEPFYLAVAREDELANRSRVSLEDVHDEPMLLLEEGHCLRDQSLAFCEREDVEPNVVFQGSSLQSILNLIRTGFGCTFVPAMVTGSGSADGIAYVPFEQPSPRRELVLLKRSSTHRSQADELFESFVNDWCRENRGSQSVRSYPE